MLYQKREAVEYAAEFKKRFVSFCNKAPILVSFSLSNAGVQVINEALKEDYTKESVLSFDWDYTLSPKEFIFAIKQVMKRLWYPKLLRVTVDPSASDSKNAVKKVMYTLDKILVFNDLFILENDETKEKEFFKFTKNSFLLIKQLKENSDPERLGEFFFANAVFQQKEEKEKKNKCVEEVPTNSGRL